MRLPILRALALLSLLASTAGTIHAGTVDTLKDPALAAVVDGRALPVRVVEMMLATARRGSQDATFNRTVDALVENQLLAADAMRALGRERVMRQDRVGFAPAVTLEQQYHALVKQTFFKQMDTFVRALPGGNLDGLLAWRAPAGDPSLAKLMSLENRGEVRLTPAQLALADQTHVARVRLPDGTVRPVTFREIYDRLNVQGRVQLLQEKDRRFLDGEVLKRVEGLFIGWWADKHSGLKPAETRLIRQLLEEKHAHDLYLFELGVVSVIHEDTPAFLSKLEQQVTRAEIRDWYGRNREQFRQVEKVRARHIRCATEQACEEAWKAVSGGMDFSAAVRKYSIADDRNANPSGDLGWLVRTSPSLPWIAQIALIQQAGQMSRPIRTPEDAKGKAAWEIVKVDERVEGYSPPESETVAYLARKEIAKRRAVEHYNTLRERLKARADIRINGTLRRSRHTAQDEQPLSAPAADDGHGHGHGHRH